MKIGLESNGIGADGVQNLATALANNESLEEIYLYNNALTNKGLEYVADLLYKKRNLRVMGLENNGLDDTEGFDILERSMQYAPNL